METALVRQKDHIVKLVNNEQYELARTLLDFTEELWESVGYGYKTKEIRNRIDEELLAKIASSTHWKQEKRWRAMLLKLY